MNRVEELAELIRYHNDKYFNDESEITDAEYDELVSELKDLEPENPVLFEVGSTPSFGKRITHDRRMGSLIKVNYVCDDNGEIVGDGLDNLRKWYRDHSEKSVWSLKMDGVAGKLVYKNGKLSLAATRGDGKLGCDITDNVKMIESIPNVLKSDSFSDFCSYSIDDAEIEFRGEFYIPLSFFRKNLAGTKANARNATSGAISCQDANETSKMGVEFKVYEIFIDGMEPLYDTDKEKIVNGIDGFSFVELHEEMLTEEIINRIYNERKTYDFMIDGLVVSINNRDDRNKYGILSGKYPKGKCAFKFKAERVETKLVGVDNSVGRSGRVTPIARLKPVELAGSTVSACTLHNYSEIRRLDLKIGDRVLIQKAGDIIPQIVRIVDNCGDKKCESPKKCPSCGFNLIDDGVNIWCKNGSCLAKLATRAEYYLKSLGIKGVGQSMIQSLIDYGFVIDIPSLYLVNEMMVMMIPNCGKRTAEIVVNAIHSVKEVELDTFLVSLGIKNLGKGKAELLAIEYKTLDEVRNATVNELVRLDKIDFILANSLVEGMNNEREMIDRLSEILKVKDYEEKTGSLTGKSFCCTGTLSRKRKEIEKDIKDNGGIVKSSVVSGLGYLVAGEGAGSKMDKARKLGVEIIDENTLEEMMD